MQGVVLDIKPNPLAMDVLSYMAYETVAQVSVRSNHGTGQYEVKPWHRSVWGQTQTTGDGCAQLYGLRNCGSSQYIN